MAIVAEKIVLQTDAIRLGTLVPVPESDVGVRDLLHRNPFVSRYALPSIYRGKLVHVRDEEPRTNSLNDCRHDFQWIVYLRLDIRSFAELVVIRNGSWLCRSPVEEFGKLQILSLDIWLCTSSMIFFLNE